MILGILSDTHGRVAMARLAVARLLAEGATYLIHAGDVGDDVLATLPEGRSAFVLGNNDWNASDLAREADLFNLTFLGAGGAVELDGVRVAVTHGDDSRQVRALLAGGGAKYLLTGHTHVRHDRREGDVRWINPGALYRAARKTIATLDLATDELRFLTI